MSSFQQIRTTEEFPHQAVVPNKTEEMEGSLMPLDH